MKATHHHGLLREFQGYFDILLQFFMHRIHIQYIQMYVCIYVLCIYIEYMCIHRSLYVSIIYLNLLRLVTFWLIAHLLVASVQTISCLPKSTLPSP